MQPREDGNPFKKTCFPKCFHSTGVYIFKKAAWGGGIIFQPSAKNGEDYLYVEILLQILIKSKILFDIFGQILNF